MLRMPTTGASREVWPRQDRTPVRANEARTSFFMSVPSLGGRLEVGTTLVIVVDELDVRSMGGLEELLRAVDAPLRVARVDGDEELVIGEALESLRVEDRVMVPRKPIEVEHSEHRRERRQED